MKIDAFERFPGDLSNAIDVAGGGYHGAAVISDGTVEAWGDNSQGQCNVPSGLDNVIKIEAGRQHTCALMSDGTVTSWGRPDASGGAGISDVVDIAAGVY
mgnify:FL=1